MATVADAWRPTSDLEHRLEETVRAGDQESYFRLLADSELVVPVPPDVVDGVLANETQPSWPTQEEDGRVHVLVYTSAAAMRACLGQTYQHFMTVRFGDIAETWPDDRWWLAVDVPARGVGAALPIESRLPSWFVRQVAGGDGRPPQVGRAAAPWEELRDQHRDLPRESSSSRTEFQPANDVERELLRAAANNDHDLFLQTLAATDVLLPVPDDTDYTLRPGRPGFPWQTREVDGSTVVPVFTSPERLIEAAHAAGTGTEYIKLPFTVALRYWPDHDWLLAINSGSPAGGTVLAQQLPGLATWADQRAAQRMTDGFDPQNDIEQRLFDTARRRDTDTFFSILLGAQVLVPAEPDTPWGIDPGDPGFPWRPVPVHGRTSIQIFTSLKWMNEAIGSSRFVMPSLNDMVAAWPDNGWTLVLNPGTPIDATMPGDQVRSLRGPDTAATPPSASTPPPPETPAVPVAPAVPAEPDAPAAQGPGVGVPGDAGPDRPRGRHAGPPEPLDEPAQPNTPAIPSTPAQPNVPAQPATPAQPAAPAMPGAGTGETGRDPAVSTTPAASAGPADETASTAPSDPAAPSDPGAPGDLSASGVPGASGFPGMSVEPSGLGEPGPNMPAVPAADHGPAASGAAPQPGETGRDAPDARRDEDARTGREGPAKSDISAALGAGAQEGPGSSGMPGGGTDEAAESPTGPSPLPDMSGTPGGRHAAGSPPPADPRDAQNVPPAPTPPGDQEQAKFTGDARNGLPQPREEPDVGASEGFGGPFGVVQEPGVAAAERAGASGEPGFAREAAHGGADASDPAGPSGRADASEDGGHPGTGHPGTGRPEAAEPGGRPLRAVREPEAAAFEAGNRIDQELYESASTGDSGAFLRVLLNANVLVPIPDDAPLEVTPTQREFRWDAALRTESSVQVFTSLVRLREVLLKSRFVYADFRELIGAWPRDDWAMLLNPGTHIGASLRGDQVRELSEWAARVGLVPARPEVPPVQRTLPPPRREPAPQQPAPDLDDRGASPAIMQKVVPHGHVAWYLEQGYDRVGGFVHLTNDVAELQAPVQLYEALGLLYEGSSFSPGDEGVYVIRWPAYCPGLYRIPFGGRDEEELAAWGDAGWVIERPPFLGGGFAPGSAGSIREYKVDSVRLPFGAEMYYLGVDRSERFVAMYDPDRLAWLRPDASADASGGGRTEAAQ
ncbi:SseB family protein [Actinomadura sp. 9N215]|uniref:SseB family protein n=1 Tax=Actinomadura sp. 9N215 TaxID=3375150 RepID=UPI0037A6F977